MKRLFALLCMASALLPLSAKDLYVNSQTYEVDTIVTKHKIGPGTTYAYYRLPDRPMEIHVLEVDLSNPYINIEVCNGGDAAVACETPSHMYMRHDSPGHDMVAATNGDFYSTTMGEVGISRMGLYCAGECIFNPTGNPLFVMDKQNNPWISYVNFAGTVSDGTSTIRLHTVNQLRLEWETETAANQLSLYTGAFGTATHSTTTGGKVATLKAVAGSASFPSNSPITMTVESVADNAGQVPIPEDGAVLYGVGTSADFVGSLAVGSTVTINLGTTLTSYPDVTEVREAIGGSGHIILKDGEILNINNPDLHPRTFMGISQDRKTIYSVIVDGRYSGSSGIDLDDEGRVLAWLGAWDGINLDGGGSSCVVVDGEIRNHNSDGNERAVGNGVLYYSTAPVDDVISEIGFEPRQYMVPVTANFIPSIYGYNQYGVLKTQNLEGVTLTCDPEVGTINERGEFVAADHVADGYIYATYNGLTARQLVHATMSELSLDYDTYIIDDRGEYPVQLSAPLGYHTYGVDPGSITWTIADPNVVTEKNGYLTGKENGTTTIAGASVNFNGSINVTTENVIGDSRDVATAYNTTDWTVKQTGGTGIALTQNGEGFELAYTGNGVSRGCNISMAYNSDFKTYGLPKTITMDINPGDVSVTSITLTYTDHHGEHGTFNITKDALEKNTLQTIVADLGDIIDTADNTWYPLTFGTLKFNTGTSAKSTEFKISVPRFVYTYGETNGVSDITASASQNESLILTPNPVHAGETVAVSGTDLPVTVYDLSGRAILTAHGTIDTAALAPGTYIVAAASAGSAKLLVK